MKWRDAHESWVIHQSNNERRDQLNKERGEIEPTRGSLQSELRIARVKAS